MYLAIEKGWAVKCKETWAGSEQGRNFEQTGEDGDIIYRQNRGAGAEHRARIKALAYFTNMSEPLISWLLMFKILLEYCIPAYFSFNYVFWGNDPVSKMSRYSMSQIRVNL